MVRIPDVDRELVADTVAAALAWRVVVDEFAVPETEVRPVAFGAVAPAADSDHLVVGRPLGKRVVGRMDRHERAAPSDERLEILHRGLAPRLAVVVRNHQVVVRERRAETVHAPAGRRRSWRRRP